MHFELKKESYKQLEATSMQINSLNKRLFSFEFKNNDELAKINVNINITIITKHLFLFLFLIFLLYFRLCKQKGTFNNKTNRT